MRYLALILILIAGFALRADQAWHGASENQPDSAAYERIARGIQERGEFEQTGPGTPARPQLASNYNPGLPLLAGGIFVLAGDDDVRLVRLLLALISALSIPLVYLIGARLASPAAGLIAAAIVAFYPSNISDAGLLLTEPLAGTLLAAAVLAILRARDRTGLRPWMLPGLLLGLTAMVRPEYAAVTVALALSLIALERRGGMGHCLAPAGVLLLTAAVILTPWTVRNASENDWFEPLSTGGGQALFVGSYQPSEGNPTKVAPDLLSKNALLRGEIHRQNLLSAEGSNSFTPERVFELLAGRQYPGSDIDVALARIGRERYFEDLRSDPLGLGEYLYRKTLRIWWRGKSELMDTIAGRLSHWAIVVLALAGLTLLFRRRQPEAWLFAAVIITATVIGVLLIASPRRALVLWPLVSVLAGIGAANALALAGSLLGRRKRPVAIA